ncbi:MULTISPECIES: ABC transporter permease [Pseudothermotoga]|nr:MULTISPECIES: ABC transporter permease [Pseudothermotoga]KUK21805.1 MAG: Inner-membrane translocator [Pseudothermotoga lettingae]MDI3494028.1 riboflavin transport system permease protein [Pseudothermotoga sp.]MDK2884956.1 riboflavin transport system permease protein [Pseudothermotoga sp.]HBJ80532.1 ABC transporter permease [Pseudothermotoga sp.]HBT25654.1 ABC transporter permease [Pseudothermotoga sp.]
MRYSAGWLTFFLFTITVAFALGIAIIFLTSDFPLESVKWFFFGPVSNLYFLGNMLSNSIPLIMTAIAAVVSFSSGLFNLGLEGQVYFGAFFGTLTALFLPDIPSFFAKMIVLLAAFFAGMMLSGVSVFLKIKLNIDELISSFLLSQATVHIIDYFLNGPMRDPSAGLAASKYIDLSFSKILPPSQLHSGIFISAFFCFALYMLMNYSWFGLETRIAKNRRFAEYIGVDVKGVWVLTMLISGGIAGLSGMVDVLGVHSRVVKGFSAGYGFNGIAVALIARNNPILVIPAAIFFSYLEAGSQVASFMSDITPEMSRIIQGAIFYLVTAEAILDFIAKRKVKKIW